MSLKWHGYRSETIESFDSNVFFSISKRSEHVYIKELNIEAKRSKLMLNCESSEAKRTCSIVEKIIWKRREHVHIVKFKYRSEANTFVSSKIYFEAKRTCLY
jgi:hypothetical protein